MLDAVIVGAGVSGIYQLHRLRSLGFTAQALEAGSGVGGTWYWNRYPGARFDSESYSYGYSFSPEILDEWEWTEHFSGQPETERYLNYVVDKLDLRRDIRCDARVDRAVWNGESWTVGLADGDSLSARFLILAIGVLSAPRLPDYPGMDSFAGPSFHTSAWEPVSLGGKRVAVIGTGATAVQLIGAIGSMVESLTVFQRSPNWCAPLHNAPITASEQAEIKAHYPEMFEKCRETFGGFIHDADSRNALETPPEEREELWEDLYRQRGFGIWMANFRDLLINEEANATITQWVAGKIRGRVKDPATAEKLIPKDHGFGTRRVPLETRYYEVYNQDNVELVDLHETPIVRITPTGIECSDRHRDFDVIVYATGFHAVTGAFDRIDIRGRDGVSLREHWKEGPRTYLGMMFAGFPNLLAVVGPHNAATFCNMPRCIESNGDWIGDLLADMRTRGRSIVEASPDAEAEWTQHVYDISGFFLLSRVKSWFTGGTDVDVPRVLVYTGGAASYRARCQEVAAAGYPGFAFA